MLRTKPNHVDDNLGAGQKRGRPEITGKSMHTKVPLGTGIVLSPSSPRGCGIWSTVSSNAVRIIRYPDAFMLHT